MTDQEQKDVHPFDVQYLRDLYDDLNTEFKKQGETLGEVKTHMATTNLILEQLKKKDSDQEEVQKEHALRIYNVEIVQSKCTADTRLKGHDRELKTLNSFMDMVKRGSGGKISTGVVDMHAERMQAAAEQAIVNSLPIKLHLVKSWPYLILVAIFCVIVTTLIMSRVATGQDVEIPTIDDIPGVGLKTNPSSQGVKQ